MNAIRVYLESILVYFTATNDTTKSVFGESNEGIWINQYCIWIKKVVYLKQKRVYLTKTSSVFG